MIKRLAWDSECFGYNVGAVNIEAEFDFQRFKDEFHAYQLVYIFSKNRISNLPLNFIKVDEKITLEKSFKLFENNIQVPNHPKQVIGQRGDVFCLKALNTSTRSQMLNLEKAILSLALVSGKYSRFNTDKRLSNNEFTKLYSSWAEKALGGKDEGFAFVFEEEVYAIITLNFIENIVAKIGLLAVSEHSRGQGIGSLLLNHAGKMTVEKGGRSLLVTTQKTNKKALSFYHRTGFNVIDEKHVYHWWRE